MVRSPAKALTTSHSSLDVLLCLRFLKGMSQIFSVFLRMFQIFHFVINLDISRTRMLMNTSYQISKLTKFTVLPLQDYHL